jgi:flavin prenyltransferase
LIRPQAVEPSFGPAASEPTSAPAAKPAHIVVGITGASGAAYGVRLLERLRELGAVTHLVVTPSGVINVHHELGLSREELVARADHAWAFNDIGACIASGSFDASAMVVAPCTMKSLAAIAHGFGDNLLTRAADVMLKERRRLVLMVRETPLNLAHLRNMTAATEMGAIVFPPLPAFYNRPQTIAEMVADTVERVVELLGVTGAQPRRWDGLQAR